MTPQKNHHKVKALIKQLIDLHSIFDASATKKKLSLLKNLSRQTITGSKTLITYHDHLSFMRAYPDNAQILKLVENELKSFGKRISTYKTKTRDKEAAELYNSGIVNTISEYAYSLGVVEHLLTNYPKNLSIDWETNDDIPDKMTNFISYLLSWQENDTFDNDDYLDLNEWLEFARGKTSHGDLETFVKLVNCSELPRILQMHFYDSLDISVTWELKNSKGSRTLRRFPCKKYFYQKEPLRRRSKDLRDELKKPAAKLKHLPVKEGLNKVRDINEILAVRNRELYPLTYSNPAEVYLYEPGRGVQIYIFGALPEIRLPLESNFGALLIRNGLPIGYGVGATLFDRVEIAINIFPAFRGGESAFIIEQFFTMFHKHFNSNIFLVRSYQIGDDNDEAINSGALWFYYKLGFRHVNEQIRKLVEKEAQKIANSKTYRTSQNQLKKLAKSDVFLHFDPNKMDGFKELSIINLGRVVTDCAAKKYDGNRKLMSQKSIEIIEKVLPMKNRSSWSVDELTALKRMAPLLANIPDLARWSQKDKKGLVDIIRSKGSTCERRHSVLAGKHKKFKTALEKLASKYSE